MKKSRQPSNGADLQTEIQVVSVTRAVRNFADLVNRCFYQGFRYRLTRGGRPMAELTPPGRDAKVTAADFRRALQRRPRLGVEEAEAFGADIDEMRRSVGGPGDSSWE